MMIMSKAIGEFHIDDEVKNRGDELSCAPSHLFFWYCIVYLIFLWASRSVFIFVDA